MTEVNIQSGRLRHYLLLQSQNDTRDADGGVVRAWQNVQYLHGEVVPTSAREFVSAEQVTQDITHIIRTRYIDGVTPSMRFMWNNRAFNIQKVINAREANVMLEYTCIEDVNA